MLKLNLTGAPVRIALPHGAALICDPLDFETINEILVAAPEAGETAFGAAWRLGCRVVRDWEGVADEATGEAVPFTAEAVPHILRDQRVMAAFFQQYARAAFGLADEGNGSPASQGGTSPTTSTAGEPTAGAARASAPRARTKLPGRKVPKARRSGA